MQTPNEVKNWYLNDSYNTDVFSSTGEKLSTNFRFGCTISQEIIDLLLKKQTKDQIYIGSNLSVLESPSGGITYELYFYTYTYSSSTSNYLVGRAIYGIIDYTIDYKSYLNSKEYIPLTVLTINNLNFNTINTSQAYKQGNNIGTLRLTINGDNGANFSLLDIYTNKTRKRYGVSNNQETNFYYTTPVYTYNYISRTPSTCFFACSLLKELKPITVNNKNIQKNILKKIDFPYN